MPGFVGVLRRDPLLLSAQSTVKEVVILLRSPFLMPLVAIRQLLPLPLTDGERREPQGYLSKY